MPNCIWMLLKWIICVSLNFVSGVSQHWGGNKGSQSQSGGLPILNAKFMQELHVPGAQSCVPCVLDETKERWFVFMKCFGTSVLLEDSGLCPVKAPGVTQVVAAGCFAQAVSSPQPPQRLPLRVRVTASSSAHLCPLPPPATFIPSVSRFSFAVCWQPHLRVNYSQWGAAAHGGAVRALGPAWGRAKGRAGAEGAEPRVSRGATLRPGLAAGSPALPQRFGTYFRGSSYVCWFLGWSTFKRHRRTWGPLSVPQSSWYLKLTNTGRQPFGFGFVPS